jgi:hypothetical protein
MDTPFMRAQPLEGFKKFERKAKPPAGYGGI